MRTNIVVTAPTALWAMNRAGVSHEVLDRARLSLREDGSVRGAYSDIVKLAKKLQIPTGWLLLPTPPVEELPIPDLRSDRVRDSLPSGNLLDTIYICQQRQQWWRQRTAALEEFTYKKPLNLPYGLSVEEAAGRMRDGLGTISAQRKNESSAFRAIANAIERRGVMVMVAGIYRDFSQRRLDLTEFRCLIMNDAVAPLIFINGRDVKSAQTFSLLYAYLRICHGESGVDDVEIFDACESKEQRWRMQVVSNALIPTDELKTSLVETVNLSDVIDQLAVRWNVSPLAVCRRAHELSLIDRHQFDAEYQKFRDKAEAYAIAPRTGRNGDYYRTLGARIGTRFARAIIKDTIEGGTRIQDASHLVGGAKHKTFRNFRAGFKGA